MQAGLRKDDKVISVNGHSCVDIDHYEAVGILKAAGSFISMRVVREVFVAKRDGRAAASPAATVAAGPRTPSADAAQADIREEPLPPASEPSPRTPPRHEGAPGARPPSTNGVGGGDQVCGVHFCFPSQSDLVARALGRDRREGTLNCFLPVPSLTAWKDACYSNLALSGMTPRKIPGSSPHVLVAEVQESSLDFFRLKRGIIPCWMREGPFGEDCKTESTLLTTPTKNIEAF